MDVPALFKAGAAVLALVGIALAVIGPRRPSVGRVGVILAGLGLMILGGIEWQQGPQPGEDAQSLHIQAGVIAALGFMFLAVGLFAKPGRQIDDAAPADRSIQD
jgi:hypothetical protein